MNLNFCITLVVVAAMMVLIRADPGYVSVRSGESGSSLAATD